MDWRGVESGAWPVFVIGVSSPLLEVKGFMPAPHPSGLFLPPMQKWPRLRPFLHQAFANAPGRNLRDLSARDKSAK
jgi:hypothetical protein